MPRCPNQRLMGADQCLVWGFNGLSKLSAGQEQDDWESTLRVAGMGSDFIGVDQEVD